MDFIRVTMQILGFALSMYSFIIFVRIILTWFQAEDFGQISYWLGRITDPYINWFRRFDFLRISRIDLSVIAALVTLWIARGIAYQIAAIGRITLGMIMAIVLGAVASAFFFFVTFFLILAIVRFLGEVFGANTATRFWIVLDQILEPIIHRVVTPIVRGRPLNYQNALLVFGGACFLVSLVGRFLVGVLIIWLRGLPF
jgi:YggT family protein